MILPPMAASPVISLRARAFLRRAADDEAALRSEEHTSELQSRSDLVCRLLLEKKKKKKKLIINIRSHTIELGPLGYVVVYLMLDKRSPILWFNLFAMSISLLRACV